MLKLFSMDQIVNATRNRTRKMVEVLEWRDKHFVSSSNEIHSSSLGNQWIGLVQGKEVGLYSSFFVYAIEKIYVGDGMG